MRKKLSVHTCCKELTRTKDANNVTKNSMTCHRTPKSLLKITEHAQLVHSAEGVIKRVIVNSCTSIVGSKEGIRKLPPFGHTQFIIASLTHDAFLFPELFSQIFKLPQFEKKKKEESASKSVNR